MDTEVSFFKRNRRLIFFVSGVVLAEAIGECLLVTGLVWLKAGGFFRELVLAPALRAKNYTSVIRTVTVTNHADGKD